MSVCPKRSDSRRAVTSESEALNDKRFMKNAPTINCCQPLLLTAYRARSGNPVVEALGVVTSVAPSTPANCCQS